MTHGIEVFQELTLHGEPGAIRSFLSKSTDEHWRHDSERESNLKEGGLGDDAIVFAREATEGLPACFLTMFEEGAGYRVTNIVPIAVGELSMEQYNRLLTDFRHRVVDVVITEGELSVEQSPAVQTMDSWIGAPAAMALRRFSMAANKSTGTAHPLDRDRWYDFVIAVHAAGAPLDTDRLARWLREVDGWSEDFAHDLAGSYETLRSFLEHYESSRS